MQRFTMLLVICLCVLMTFFAGWCEGPQGPVGPQGESGRDGKDAGFIYFEQFKDSLKCGTCHTPGIDTTYYVAGRVYEYQNSRHATGGSLERNGSSCAGCHTTEGAIQSMGGKAVTAQLHPSPPGCFACHSPHQRGDFSLRNMASVSLASNIVGVAASTFDYGKGNLCVQCHKPRSVSPQPDPTKTATTDTIKITSSRWYAHYGVQGQLLMGEGGFKFQGYSYTGNSFHSSSSTIKQEGCTVCHMAEQSYSPNLGTGKAGGHTMNLEFENEGSTSQLITGCKVSGCHGTSLTSFDYKSGQSKIQANMDTLKAQLIAKGWIDSTNTIKGSSSSPIVIVPASRSGALFNYMLVYHDGSKGVHNTNYTLELLRSSVEELRKP